MNNEPMHLLCVNSFVTYCVRYHSDVCNVWRDEQLNIAVKLQQALKGDNESVGTCFFQRGSGKTTLALLACKWAKIIGYNNPIYVAHDRNQLHLLPDIAPVIDKYGLLQSPICIHSEFIVFDDVKYQDYNLVENLHRNKMIEAWLQTQGNNRRYVDIRTKKE